MQMIEHNIYNQNWRYIGKFYSSKVWTTFNYCKCSKTDVVRLLNLNNESIRESKYFYIKPLT